VFVGGVIPQQDYEFLYDAGVKGIYGPGTPIPASAKDVLEQIRKRFKRHAPNWGQIGQFWKHAPRSCRAMPTQRHHRTCTSWRRRSARRHGAAPRHRQGDHAARIDRVPTIARRPTSC
jgi:hypothetical protein